MSWVSEGLSSVDSFVSELLLDSKNLVVFGKSVGSAWGSRLDFSSSETANEISDEVILSLSTSVGDHNSPAGSLGHVACLDTLSYGTNLVHLEEEGIAQLLVDTSLHSSRVCHQEVISDDLNLIAHKLGHLDISLEVILIEWVLDGHKGVLIAKILVKSDGFVLGKDSIVLASLLTEVIGLLHWVEEL